MKKRNEKSSLRLGRIAARLLANRTNIGCTCRNCRDIRSLAASVLTQLPDKAKRKVKFRAVLKWAQSALPRVVK